MKASIIRIFFVSLLLAELCCSCAGEPSPKEVVASSSVGASPTFDAIFRDSQKMLIFGGESSFLVSSELQMPEFAPGIILEVLLSQRGRPLREFLANDRQRTGELFYIMETEPLAASELAQLDSVLMPRKLFSGRILRGQHGEKGESLLEKIEAKIIRVVYPRPGFRTMSTKLKDGWLVFGSDHELFAWKMSGSMQDHGELRSVRLNEGVLSKKEAAAFQMGKVFVRTAIRQGDNLEFHGLSRFGSDMGQVRMNVLSQDLYPGWLRRDLSTH